MKKIVYFLPLILLIISSCAATKTFPHQKRSPSQGQWTNQSQSSEAGFPAQNQTLNGQFEINPMQPRMSARFNVALLVPLTGGAASIGQSIFDATQMAVFENSEVDMIITPYDTQGTAEGATEAAYKAISDDTDLILGPLFGSSARLVAPIARTAKIKVISFSNDKTAAGNGVYMMGLIPEQQIERVVRYAGQRGVQGFSAIVPNDVYGHTVKEALQENVKWAGKTLRKTEVYSSTKPQFNVAVKAIVNNYNRNNVVLDQSTEALLIPQGGEVLERMLIALQQEGIGSDQVKILGSSLWDNEETLSIPELSNAWYASVPYRGMEDFMNRFTASFGYRPKTIASLGYDAAKLAAILTESEFSDRAINDQMGFVGSNGLYRFDSRGVNERAYEILEVSGGQILVVDPARYSF